MLVMFASATICCCDHEARAGQTASHQHIRMASQDDNHCSDHQKKDEKNQSCMDKTMQLSANVTLAKLDLKNSLHLDLDYAWISEKPSWSPAIADATAIRGPPFGGYPPDPGIPVYLTTQRLRI